MYFVHEISTFLQQDAKDVGQNFGPILFQNLISRLLYRFPEFPENSPRITSLLRGDDDGR